MTIRVGFARRWHIIVVVVISKIIITSQDDSNGMPRRARACVYCMRACVCGVCALVHTTMCVYARYGCCACVRRRRRRRRARSRYLGYRRIRESSSFSRRCCRAVRAEIRNPPTAVAVFSARAPVTARGRRGRDTHVHGRPRYSDALRLLLAVPSWDAVDVENTHAARLHRSFAGPYAITRWHYNIIYVTITCFVYYDECSVAALGGVRKGSCPPLRNQKKKKQLNLIRFYHYGL